MKYAVFYKPSAVKELENLPRTAQSKVIEAVLAFRQGDFYKVEKLKGYEGLYRSKRAWPYRILFTLDRSAIRITNVVHRQGARAAER